MVGTIFLDKQTAEMSNSRSEVVFFKNLKRNLRVIQSKGCYKSQKNINADMEKVKKFPLAEFLGCVILDMSKAIEKCENCSIFSKLDIY